MAIFGRSEHDLDLPTSWMNGGQHISFPAHRRCHLPLVLVSAVFLMFVAGFTFVTINTSQSLDWALLFAPVTFHDTSLWPSGPPRIVSDCGSNLSEAQKKGCRYDVMLGHWVPPHCFQEDIHDSFFPLERWTWFRDSEFTSPIPKEDVLKGEHNDIYVGQDFHLSHCAYLWQLQMRAYTTEGPLDDHIFSYEHTVHCAQMLVRGYPGGANYTRIVNGFNICINPSRRLG